MIKPADNKFKLLRMGLSQSIQNFSEKIPNAISDKMKSAQEVAMRAQMERQLAMQNEMRKKKSNMPSMNK